MANTWEHLWQSRIWAAAMACGSSTILTSGDAWRKDTGKGYKEALLQQHPKSCMKSRLLANLGDALTPCRKLIDALGSASISFDPSRSGGPWLKDGYWKLPKSA
jgi:hypothetical protein